LIKQAINNGIATLKPESGSDEFKIKLSFLKKIDKAVVIPQELPVQQAKTNNTEEETSIDEEELELERTAKVEKWSVQTRKRPRTFLTNSCRNLESKK